MDLSTENSAPLISVVIGTFNSERYLREAIDSVFAQTYQHFEIVVADNLSTDRTIEIAKGYGDRVRIKIMDAPCLPGGTRNAGMLLSRGTYIAFLDSDDAWYPAKLEKQVAFMNAHPEVALCHSYCHVVDEESRVQFVRHEGGLPATGPCFRQLLRNCFITLSSAMVRRALVEKEQVRFPTDPVRDRTGEELLFFLKLARAHPFGLLDDVLVKYRRYGDSISGRIGWKIVPENAVVLETVLTDSTYWQDVVPRAEVLDAFRTAALNNCAYWRDRKNTSRAAYFALWSLRRDPLSGAAWTALAKSLGKMLYR